MSPPAPPAALFCCTALSLLQAAISTITRVQDQMGISDVSLLNFVVSDGATMIATRFVRPESEAAATLYYAEGASFDRLQPQQHHASSHEQQAAAGPAAAGGVAEPAVNGASNCTSSSSSSVADEKVSSCGGCPAAVASGSQEGAAVGTQELVGSSVLCEASYGISYSERGASVAFVASEPITGSTTDWVSAAGQQALGPRAQRSVGWGPLGASLLRAVSQSAGAASYMCGGWQAVALCISKRSG